MKSRLFVYCLFAWKIVLKKIAMSPQFSTRSTFPFWLMLCLLLSLGSVGVLATTPAFAQNRKQNSEQSDQNLSQREDADFQLSLGREAQQQGQLDKAIFYWLKGLGLAYDYLGEAYVAVGDAQGAEDAFRRRLAVARDRNDLQAQMFALNNLGTLFLKQGNLNIAEEVFSDALAIARSVENLLTAGMSLNNLGLTASLRGDYNQAIKLYSTALLFRRKAKDPAGEAITLNNLGEAYLRNEQSTEAIAAYRDAFFMAGSVGDTENQFRAYEGKFFTYKAMGESKLALRELNRWADFAKTQNNQLEEFKTFEQAGYLYAELGDQDQAISFLTKAIELATAIGELDRIAFIQQRLSAIQYGDLK
jgi:tetratricopeptide (TPR) repeat protein